MVDEVLRLRATVVSDEALANIRRIGREIGLVQQQGGRAAKAAVGPWQELHKHVKETGEQFLKAVPALEGWGLGAAGVGISARLLVGTLSEVSKSMVSIGYASKEMGISARELKAFQDAAEKVGIAPEAMTAHLGTFKQNMLDFKNNVGALRGELVAIAGPEILAALRNAKSFGEQVKVAFQWKEILDTLDATGEKGRKAFELLGLGPETARLRYEDYIKTLHDSTFFTPEQMQKAKEFQQTMVELGQSWDVLKTNTAVLLFPEVAKDLRALTELVGLLDKLTNWKLPGWMTLNPVELADRAGRALGIDPTGLRAKHDAEDKEREERALKDAKTSEEKAAAERMAAEGRAHRLEKTPEEIAAEAADAKAKRDAAMARMREIEQQRRDMWNLRPEFKQGVQLQSGEGFNPAFVHKASFGGAASSNSDEAAVSRIIQVGVFDALVQFKGYMDTGATGGGGGGGGFQRASYGPGGGGGGGGGSGGQAAARPGPGGQGTAPAGATVPKGASSGSFMDALAGIESGDKNIVSGVDRDRSGRTAAEGGNADEISQGHFQINTDTWRDFAPKAGVDLTKYPSAMKAPREVQALVASTIPLSRFGPRTQRMMRERFGPLDTSQTVGTLAEQHGGVPSGARATGWDGTEGGKPPGTGPDAEMAPSGEAPAAFIMHHTGGGGTPQSVVDFWKRERPGIGSQFIMDREGVVHDTRKEFNYPGTNQIMPGWGPKGAGLSNRNTVGMEIIAKDDKDVTPAQAAAAAAWMAKNYPNTPVAGHGEVNPGHKQEREGMTAVEAVEAERKRRAQMQPTDTSRIDAAVAPPPPSGQVHVTVNSNGTKADAETKTNGDLFQPPKIQQHRQMQPTEASGGTSI